VSRELTACSSGFRPEDQHDGLLKSRSPTPSERPPTPSG
jgi:hypothetical protein